MCEPFLYFSFACCCCCRCCCCLLSFAKLYSSLWPNGFLSYDKTELNFAHAHSAAAIKSCRKCVIISSVALLIHEWRGPKEEKNTHSIKPKNSLEVSSLRFLWNRMVRAERSLYDHTIAAKKLINNNYYPCSAHRHRHKGYTNAWRWRVFAMDERVNVIWFDKIVKSFDNQNTRWSV